MVGIARLELATSDASLALCSAPELNPEEVPARPMDGWAGTNGARWWTRRESNPRPRPDSSLDGTLASCDSPKQAGVLPISGGYSSLSIRHLIEELLRDGQASDALARVRPAPVRAPAALAAGLRSGGEHRAIVVVDVVGDCRSRRRKLGTHCPTHLLPFKPRRNPCEPEGAPYWPGTTARAALAASTSQLVADDPYVPPWVDLVKLTGDFSPFAPRGLGAAPSRGPGLCLPASSVARVSGPR